MAVEGMPSGLGGGTLAPVTSDILLTSGSYARRMLIMPAPLEAIRVVDFTRYQNGPHATAMLADMGADDPSRDAPRAAA